MRIATLGLLLLPALVSAQEADYFPLQEGNTWVYESQVKVEVKAGPFGKIKTKVGTPLRVTVVCGAPELRDGELYHPVTWSDNTGALDAKVWVRSQGSSVHIHEAIGSRLLLLPGDLSGGQGPGLDVGFGGHKVRLQNHAVGHPETLSLPIGPVEAIPVASGLQLDHYRLFTRVYYAPGLGPVRIEEEIKVKKKKTAHLLLLRSFTPGTPSAPPPPEETVPEPPPPAEPYPPARERPAHSDPPVARPDHVCRQGCGCGSEPEPEVPEAEPWSPEPARPPAHPEPSAPPARAQPRGEIMLPGLIKRLVARGDPSDWRELERRSDQAWASCAQHGLPAPLKALPRAQRVGLGILSRDVIDDTLLVSNGPVDVLGLDEAAVFVNGSVTVRGDVLDAVVVATGNVVVTGTLKGSVILCGGQVRLSGYAKASTFQARGVSSGSYSKACLYVRTPQQVRESRGDRLSDSGPSPWDAFRSQ